MRLFLTRRLAVSAFAAILLLVGTAGAHPLPRSLVILDLRPEWVGAELRLPLDRLVENGLGRPPTADPRADVSEAREALAQYLARHVSVTSPAGEQWSVEVLEISVVEEEPAHEVMAHLRLVPPNESATRAFILTYDVILHETVDHRALVLLRSDWEGGTVASAPEALGELGWGATTIWIDRGEGSAWRGFTSFFRHGMHHIAEGTDHLLFLLVLLLPAAVVARGARWDGYAGMRQSFRRIVAIVTAFTIGHSLTLFAGAVEWIQAPAQPVEVVIALSILVGAIHALRPIFPGKEALIAGIFGLVHGLAFAELIGVLGMDGWRTALTIFAFNIGIEAMQLIVVAVTMPWLLLLARTRAEAPVRTVGAAVAGVAALAWIAERTLDRPNALAAAVDALAAHAGWLVATVAVLAVSATLYEATTTKARWTQRGTNP